MSYLPERRRPRFLEKETSHRGSSLRDINRFVDIRRFVRLIPSRNDRSPQREAPQFHVNSKKEECRREMSASLYSSCVYTVVTY